MRNLVIIATTFGLSALGLSTASTAETLQTSAGSMTATPVVSGLTVPWAFGFLPDGTILITEREGQLLARLPSGDLVEIAGVPPVAAQGQGGLLDVMIPRDFANTREIYLTYAKHQDGGAGTAVARAVLDLDARSLRNATTIFEMSPGTSGGRHFGSRLVESSDGTLFLTIGDRGDRPSAQDRSSHNGTVVRITRDGGVPADNPFVATPGIQPEIWSYGHRNPQGAALDLSGQLWAVEHGAQGGDEVNRITAGANYGWPVISYGRHYSGRKIGEGTARPDMEQPEFYWDPSIAPSGMTFFAGDIPEWRGDLFIGSLKFDYISRLEGTPLREVEQIRGDATARVRDVRTGPDGDLWFLSVGNGALYRLTPGG